MVRYDTREGDGVMAIYHLSVKVIGRNSGRSSVGAAAYRAGDKLTNEYDGVTHDYTNKKGIEYSEIMLPDNAPREYYDRATLWNEVECIEKTKDAQLAREIEVALPTELDLEQQKELVRRYVRENFVEDGMCADFAIHNPGKNNPHAHIMLTVRPLDEYGNWQKKALIEYICTRPGSGERKFTPSEFEVAKKQGWQKQYKFKDGNRQVWFTMKEGKKQGLERVNRNPKTSKFGRMNPISERWNSVEAELLWRKNWELVVNETLERLGFDARIDCRSFKDQGRLDEIPTVHIGPAATAIERRAKKELLEGKVNVARSAMAMLNAEIKEHNRLVKELNAKIDDITKQINELSATAVRKIEELKAELHIYIKQRNTLYKEEREKNYELSKLKATIEELTNCIDKINKANDEAMAHIEALNKERTTLGLFDGKRKQEINQQIANQNENINTRKQYLKSVLGGFNLVDIKGLNHLVSQCSEVDEEHRHIMEQATDCIEYIKRIIGECLYYVYVLGDNAPSTYNKEDILQELQRNNIQLSIEDIEFINKEYGVNIKEQDFDKNTRNRDKDMNRSRGR